MNPHLTWYLAVGAMLFSAGLVCVAIALSACSTGDSPTIATPEGEATSSPAASGSAVTGSIKASDITSDGSTVTVEEVTITGGKGFIAFHKDLNNTPGPVAGHSALLAEGTSSNVKITLDAKIESGDYWPMLHVDANNNGTYDFPGADSPVLVGGAPVMKKIKVTVS